MSSKKQKTNRKFVCDDDVCRLLSESSDNYSNNSNDSNDSNDSNTKFPYPLKKDEWTIYGADWCGFCKAAVDLLNHKKIEYVYHDVDNLNGFNKNDVKKLLAESTTNHKTIPIIFRNGVFLGGYTDLKKYLLPAS